jgi:hypothetical protein
VNQAGASVTYEEFEREMALMLRRRADFEVRFQAKMEAIRAQQAEFDAGMVGIRDVLRQLEESEARMENSLRQIRGRKSAE